MDPRKQALPQLHEEHRSSPPVETHQGHRRIPDDTHKSQGVTGATMSFCPREKQCIDAADIAPWVPPAPNRRAENHS